MKSCIDSEKVVGRLKRVQGQIGGIIKMIESEKDCEDVLIQIGAAKAALHKAGQSVLEGHLHHCVRDAINEGHGEDALEHLSKAIEQFIKIYHDVYALKNIDPLEILNILYDCSAIGHTHYYKENNTTRVLFKYRNRSTAFEKSDKILLHRGLWKAMNVDY